MERLAFAKEECYREQLRADRIQPMAGVVSWLEALRTAGIPCAVGSSTPRANIDCAMSMWEWDGYFVDIVSAEDVSRGKPDPEVFVLAAQRLGLAPERVVVFEDSTMGVEAARMAVFDHISSVHDCIPTIGVRASSDHLARPQSP